MSEHDPVDDALNAPGPTTRIEPSGASVVDEDELGDAHALTDPNLPQSIVWYVYRLDVPPAAGQRRVRPRYCAKYEGALDLERLRVELGGGSYKVSGFVDNKAYTSGRLEIDGPRKTFDREPAPASSAPAASDRLERIERQLDELARGGRQLTATVRSGDGLSLENLTTVLELVERMRGGSSPAVATSELLEMLKQGIAIGATREAGPASTDWPQLLEKALPVVERALQAMAQRRPAIPGAQPQVAAEPNAAPAPAPTASRLLTFVESLAKGVTRKLHPGQLADAAVVLLTDDELAALRMASVEGLLQEIAPVLERFPILQTPEGHRYIAELLAELNSDGDGEGDA